jgi:hypothetical protein
MNQSDAWCMIRRRAAAVGITTEIDCHTFRATGITAYFTNGGAFEHAQEMAGTRKPAHDQTLRRDKGAAHTGRGEEKKGFEIAVGSVGHSFDFVLPGVPNRRAAQSC